VSSDPSLRIVIASSHNRHNDFKPFLEENFNATVLLVRGKEELNFSTLSKFNPNYIFCPHWSWKIPAEVFENFECVIFHMTDLPYGRGGSPLQNLIARGIYETQLTALRCVDEMDAGPIYLKTPLSLFGSAEEILLRASQLTLEMISRILKERPEPRPQSGEPTIFYRRSPQDGDISSLNTLERVFDFIRMLDGDGYPLAFFENEYFKFEFSRASLKEDCILADVKISRK
jgi:methionyl-tRNA formyltransferase